MDLLPCCGKSPQCFTRDGKSVKNSTDQYSSKKTHFPSQCFTLCCPSVQWREDRHSPPFPTSGGVTHLFSHSHTAETPLTPNVTELSSFPETCSELLSAGGKCYTSESEIKIKIFGMFQGLFGMQFKVGWISQKGFSLPPINLHCALSSIQSRQVPRLTWEWVGETVLHLAHLSEPVKGREVES